MIELIQGIFNRNKCPYCHVTENWFEHHFGNAFHGWRATIFTIYTEITRILPFWRLLQAWHFRYHQPIVMEWRKYNEQS